MRASAEHTNTAPASRRSALASLAIAVAGGAASAWGILDRGWVPLDEGTIGQAAERVLHGQLPHREFIDPYTGGLAWLHAIAMHAFGVSLMAPRYALFIAFVLWLPAFWWLAMRSCGPAWALMITIIGAWWSLPVYPAAMPTWYLLFLGTWIVVALERWHASKPQGRPLWLVLIGVLCGIAILVKQTGLYLLAGALLGILAVDQADEQAGSSSMERSGRTDVGIVLLLAFLGALVFKLMWGQIYSGNVLNEVLPVMAVLTLAALREWHLSDNRARRWKRLARYVGIVFAAASVPVAFFLVPYATSGTLRLLYADAIGEGAKRISWLHWSMRPALVQLIVPWPAYCAVVLELCSRRRRILGVLAVLAAIPLLWLSARTVNGYQGLWYLGASMLPLGVCLIFVAGYRAWRGRRAFDPLLVALAGITAFQALNQFPYAAPNYFAYVAPLAILTAGAAAAHFGVLPRSNVAALLLAGFAGIVLRVGSVHNVGYYPMSWDYSHRLAMARGGLRVSDYDSARYTHMLDVVARHREGGAVRTGPELPEVYFLAGQQSPGRDANSLFATPPSDTIELARAFDTAATSVIVLKQRPMFGPPLRDDLYQWLKTRYPDSETQDSLEVRWRRRP
ncbi:MAG: hypothetical protein ACREN6_13810 [Gemmatimonadaceae bacterium]